MTERASTKNPKKARAWRGQQEFCVSRPDEDLLFGARPAAAVRFISRDKLNVGQAVSSPKLSQPYAVATPELLSEVLDKVSKKKSPACSHPYIRKGYYLGLPGDDYVCVSCGEQRPAEQWEDFELRRTPPKGLPN